MNNYKQSGPKQCWGSNIVDFYSKFMLAVVPILFIVRILSFPFCKILNPNVYYTFIVLSECSTFQIIKAMYNNSYIQNN